jgi:surfeit locus 1 family protein
MTPVQRQAVVWLATALGIALTVSLGCWQVRRADEKRHAYETLQQRQHLAPWANADWPCTPQPDPSALPQYRPVVLHGHWLADRTVLLDNRPMDGASGFVVVTPLRLSGDAAACAGRVVLVQRGWVPRDQRDRLHLPDLPTPAAQVQVNGRVISALTQSYQLGHEAMPTTAGPVVRQNADVAFWSAWLGQAPLAGAVLQMQADEPAASTGLLRRHWPEPGQGQDKHLAYAAQWFALAALMAGLAIWYQIIRPRRTIAHVHS